MMNGTWRITIWAFLMVLGLAPAVAQEDGWPKSIALEDGATVTIYEPQVEEMTESFVRFRAALAYRESPGAEPVFGAGWFESELQLNRFSRTAHPVDMDVTQTRFPLDADVQRRLGETMAQPGFAANFSFSLDELEASQRAARAEKLAAEQLKTAPPRIIYRDRPALLVTIDGEPVLREIEDSDLEAVINTPYPLIHDGENFYLNVAEDAWYRSASAIGPYRFIDEAPESVALLVKPEDEAVSPEGSTESVRITAASAPEIIVSTEPAELVVTDGPAAFVPLVDDLLVLDNSEDDVFMHTGEQRYYIVLSGRWYRSGSLNGPWEFHDSDDLPEAFARIPDDSQQAESRVYVAGTEEAEQAVLDAQVPQTAAVARGEADVDVQYDGEPVFQKVDGTDMVYAANSGSTVLYSDGLYYLVEDGVWYVSTQPEGPWQVAVARPDQVRVILPSSPVYPVKYVYIYDYTPDVVYVGYTPGYVGSYVYGSTVVYGSGWHYRPWVSHRYYYPRRSTWGFHVNYDPWYGWNFGLSWAWGPINLTYWTGGYWHHNHYWHHRHYGYWGPHGYRPRHHRYRPPHHRPPGHRPPAYGGGHGGGHGSQPYERHRNLYADENQRAPVRRTRDRQPATVSGSSQRSSMMAKRPVSKDKRFVSAKPARPDYASSAAVSRGELSRKAKSSDLGLARSKTRMSAREPQPVKNGPRTQPAKPGVSRKDLELKAKAVSRDEPGRVAGKSEQQAAWAANRARAKGEQTLPSKGIARPPTRSASGKAAPPKQVAGRSDSKVSSRAPYRKTTPQKPVTVSRSASKQTAVKSEVRKAPRSAPGTFSAQRLPKAMPRVKLTDPGRKMVQPAKPINNRAPAAVPRPQSGFSQRAAPQARNIPAPSRQQSAPVKRQKAAPPSRYKSSAGKSRQKM